MNYEDVPLFGGTIKTRQHNQGFVSMNCDSLRSVSSHYIGDHLTETVHVLPRSDRPAVPLI